MEVVELLINGRPPIEIKYGGHWQILLVWEDIYVIWNLWNIVNLMIIWERYIDFSFIYIHVCVWERERERERYVIVYVIFIKSVAKQGLSCDSSCDTYLYKNKNCYRDL
jgi:hypothetical protein